jgi:hypothetical protein
MFEQPAKEQTELPMLVGAEGKHNARGSDNRVPATTGDPCDALLSKSIKPDE